MSDFDESKNGADTGQNMSDWERDKKKFERRMKNSKSVGVFRRTTPIDKDAECSIIPPSMWDEETQPIENKTTQEYHMSRKRMQRPDNFSPMNAGENQFAGEPVSSTTSSAEEAGPPIPAAVAKLGHPSKSQNAGSSASHPRPGSQDRANKTADNDINTNNQQQSPEPTTTTITLKDQPSSENQPSSLNQPSTPADLNQPSPFPRTYTGQITTSRQSPETGALGSRLAAKEDWGPDKSALVLLKSIQAGALAAEDLAVEERRAVVLVLKGQGRTQDEIAALLSVSRRTIVSDYRWLKDQAVDELRAMETYDLGADVYTVAQDAMIRALADGKFRTVSQILKDMVDILQSLGIVYKAPVRSKVAAMVGHVGLQQGFGKYMEGVAGESDKVTSVLAQMMQSLNPKTE